MIQNNKYIRFDWAIKRLLRNKANFVVLEGFLSVLLGEDVKIVKFYENEENQESCDEKYNSVEILCEDCKKGWRVIVEIQIKFSGYYIRREWAGEIDPKYYVLKVNDFDSVAKTPLDEWVSFLKTGIIEDSYTAKGLPEAREKLRVDKLSDEERRAYVRELERRMVENDAMKSSYIDGKDEGLAEGLAKGLAEGRTKGLAEGLTKGLMAVARNMKQAGKSIEEIVQMTGLSSQELKDL